MKVAVYSPLIYNIVTGNLNCILCSRFLVIPKMPILYKPKFIALLNEGLYRTNRTSGLQLKYFTISD